MKIQIKSYKTDKKQKTQRSIQKQTRAKKLFFLHL